MKRLIIASVIAVTVVAAAAAGTAWGASGPSSAIITFDDVAQQVTLQIPDPPCDVTEPNCVWKFFLNEPKESVDVATIFGTSGTLTLPYPANFCGIIQADAYVGPSMNGPWVPKRGWQHQIPPPGHVRRPRSHPPRTLRPPPPPPPRTEDPHRQPPRSHRWRPPWPRPA